MKIAVYPSAPAGDIKAIASKSVAHRMLICAAFANEPSYICCEQTNNDIEATADCLRALGVVIERNECVYKVNPISKKEIVKNAILPCGESGSTLRFLLPVAAALGAECTFKMEGRLPSRPISILKDELEAHGISFHYDSPDLLRISGQLAGSAYKIAGNVSSQFISGLLFALSLLDSDSTLEVTGNIESAPYVDITLDTLALFGVRPSQNNNIYSGFAKGILSSPSNITVEGDWSNAAFPLALGVIGAGNALVKGLNDYSSQGDKKIVDLLRAFGGNITKNADGYLASTSKLHAIKIDASQIPDLVPILATVASVAQGETVIYGASRLRLKESDRLDSVCSFLSAIGADIAQTDDGLIINGKERLSGGEVSSFNDHRIAMSAAVAATVCDAPVIINGAEATSKSYPSFWEDMASLGIHCQVL